MMAEQKEFITKLFTDASKFRGIQLPDEDCLGKLQNIIERVQYLPNLENSTLYEDFTRLPSPVTRDFSIVQIMLVTSTQCASFDSNFHDNYLSFLENIGSVTLYDEVLLTTCVISKTLLRPEILSHLTLNQVPPNLVLRSSEFLLRVLKNLGGWLGKLVVSTKRFLCKTDIDLKSLIVEAYEQGLMTKTIPFVLEFLEPCSKSLLYTHSNPWTMMILKLLYEIYMMSNMQAELRLSIQGSLEKFGVLEQLKPASILQKKHRMVCGDDYFPMTEAKQNPLEVAPDRDVLLMYSRNKLSDELLITIKKSSSFFGIYPELERKMKVLVLNVLKKFGPLLIKLAVTVARERVKAAFFMYYHNGRADWSETWSYFNDRNKSGCLAKEFTQHTGKIFLRGWMSYLVGDLLQQHDVPYGLQRAIVEGVIDDNLECICKRLGECAAEEANENKDFEKQMDSWAQMSHKNLVSEISIELVKDVDVDAMSNFLKTVKNSDEEKLAALFKVVCDQFNFQKDPPSICMYAKKMAYLDPLVKGGNGRMQDLMLVLENFCKNASFSRGLEDLLVDGFRRTGYLSETVILEWFEQGRTRAENKARLSEYVRDLACNLSDMEMDQLLSEI